VELGYGQELKVKVGDKAPNFKLKNQDGEVVELKDFLGKGKQVILYFYPKDMTPGCTTEACEFNTSLDEVKKRKAVVLGVSKDSVEKHQKFIAKYNLAFQLLADEEGEVCNNYGVWQEKRLYGKKSMGIVRTTFIIDGEGVISHIYNKVKVAGHVAEVLRRL